MIGKSPRHGAKSAMSAACKPVRRDFSREIAPQTFRTSGWLFDESLFRRSLKGVVS